MSMETDLAVGGGGIAGLTAANRAAQLGARVLVLEAGEDEHYACNSRIATGVLNVAHTDPHSDPALLRQAIEVDTEGHAMPALADALAGTVGRVMAWLRVEGARMIKVPIHGTSRWMLAPPRIARDGAPLPGLLAAGACTGGIEGGPLGGYVGGFLKAATLGFIAAETIGAKVGAPTP